MFFTPGWAAILTVGGTLGGVIVTQFVNVWKARTDAVTKQQDRQHERALDYEKRVWQAKSDALKRLISGCRFVRWQAQWNEEADANVRRAATMRALDQFRNRIGDEDGISEVMAFAAEPVCQALEAVLAQVNVLRSAHPDELAKLRRVGTQIDADAQEPVTHNSGAMLRRALWGQQGHALDAIGRTSNLNVDEVIALCEKVIDVAREDLQGG